MGIAITPIYAGLLGLLYLHLSVRVINGRRGARVALGDGGDLTLQRRIRVHGNFAEYTPLTLLLIAFAETGGSPAWLVHGLGLALLLGRSCHAYGVSQEPENFRWRTAGMALTFATLGIASAALLALAVGRAVA